MQKYLNIKILVPACSVLLAFIVYGFVGGATDNPQQYLSDSGQIEEAAVHLRLFSKFLDEYSEHKQAETVTSDTQKRDPFYVPSRPPKKIQKKKEKKKVYRPRVRLSGILWNETSPSAIINNKVYTRGQKIGKYEIRTIQNNAVTLATDTDIFTVQLKKKRR